MTKTVYEKMGIKPDEKVIFLNGDGDAIANIKFPRMHIEKSLNSKFDHIILFVKTEDDMKSQFRQLKSYLRQTGKLWLAWPKTKQLGSDLNIKTVIKIGYENGLVESTNLSINSVWTALKFTWPKPGKIYNNSYGVLIKG